MHHSVLQDGQAPALSPKLLAVYMPWFGDHTTWMSVIPATTAPFSISKFRRRAVWAYQPLWLIGTVKSKP